MFFLHMHELLNVILNRICVCVCVRVCKNLSHLKDWKRDSGKHASGWPRRTKAVYRESRQQNRDHLKEETEQNQLLWFQQQVHTWRQNVTTCKVEKGMVTCRNLNNIMTPGGHTRWGRSLHFNNPQYHTAMTVWTLKHRDIVSSQTSTQQIWN